MYGSPVSPSTAILVELSTFDGAARRGVLGGGGGIEGGLFIASLEKFLIAAQTHLGMVGRKERVRERERNNVCCAFVFMCECVHVCERERQIMCSCACVCVFE